MEQFYKCISSKKIKILTFLVSLSMIIVSISLLCKLGQKNSMNLWIGTGGMIFVWIVYLITYIFSPRYISLSKESLNLQCSLFKKSFLFKNIDYIKKGHSICGIRQFGSNGIWGYIGIIDSDKKYYTLFNNEKQIIEISYNKKIYILSCENSKEVIEKVNIII